MAFAKRRMSAICGILAAGPKNLTEPANYANFLNLEMNAPEEYKYSVAFRQFNQDQIYYLHKYVMETFLNDKKNMWDIVERGRVLINISKHICFLYVNETLKN